MGWSYSLEELARDIGAAAPGIDARFNNISTDTRTLQPGDLFFALRGEKFDAEAFVADAIAKGAIAAVCAADHPGLPVLRVGDALAALGAFAAAHRRRYPVPMFAVTGSTGKTTVKDMTAAVLSTRYRVAKNTGNLNNEIGVPRTLLAIDDNTEFAVVEMGANHQGEIARLCAMASPTCSAVTMVAACHLEGFGRTLDDVERAKGEIAEGLSPEGVFFVNTDDPRCVRIAERFSGRKIRYGREGEAALRRAEYNAAGELELEIDPVGRIALPLPVRAHAMNALLAIAVGLEHGVEVFEEPLRDACKNAIRFKVRTVAGAEIIDDTYNANPVSMAAALDALRDRPAARRRYAVLGTMLELGPDAPMYHRDVGEIAARVGIDALLTYGPFGADLAEGARAAGLADAAVYDTHEAIGTALFERLAPGDSVLFKGSRGMAMERAIAALEQRCASETSQ